MKKTLIALMAIIACCTVSHGTQAVSNAYASEKNTLYFFYGKGCPHCEKVSGYLETYTRQFNLDVKRFEVWYDAENRNKLIRMGKERGQDVGGVPAIIMGRDVYVGSNQEKIESLIRKNAKK